MLSCCCCVSFAFYAAGLPCKWLGKRSQSWCGGTGDAGVPAVVCISQNLEMPFLNAKFGDVALPHIFSI